MAIDPKPFLDDVKCLGLPLSDALNVALLNRLLSGPYELQVQLGLIAGTRRIVIMGNNPDVDIATTPEDVWEAGGLYPFQLTAQPLEILSSSAADAAAGTGARTVIVSGLNASWVEQSETVSLNGVGVVPLLTPFFRVNRCECLTAGTGQANAGIITLRVAGAGATQAIIGIADGRAHQAIYTVPAGKTLFFISREAALLRQAAAVGVECAIHFRDGSTSAPWGVRNLFGLQSDGTSAYVKELPFLAVGRYNDVRATVLDATANNAAISITLEAFLIDN